MEKPKFHSKEIRLFFFWSGIIATFCYRAIVIINNYSHFWAQTFWYIGTIGFIIYFAHRYQVSEYRARLIKESGLYEKIRDIEGLDENQKAVVKYIFDSIHTSKEKWNSIFIFASSFVALVIGIYLDFIKGI